jgi:Glyoxalase-like domain
MSAAWTSGWPGSAGATVIREDVQDGVPDHFVMADPEGNEFCVV